MFPILANLARGAQRQRRGAALPLGRHPEARSLCYPVPRRMHLLLRAVATLLLSLLLVFGSSGDLKLSALDLAILPHQHQLVYWELTHLPDKWSHKVLSYLPWRSTPDEERLEKVHEFFELSGQIRSLEDTPLRGEPSSDDGAVTAGDAREAAESLREAREQRADLRPIVEETLESHISAIARDEGLDGWLGIIFPPVDVALESPPMLLTTSPRHTIRVDRSILLKPEMSLEEREALEDTILEGEDLSALVEGIGGVATYPSVVTQGSGLRGAAITAAHEWLHTYWFLRPLGWNYWRSPEMTTLNETAASLAGQEMGLRAYSALTGEPYEMPVRGDEPNGAALEDPPALEEDVFDFRHEMHATRLRVDDLLEQGRVEAAEEYMEARRLVFVEEGYPIRKLNQAYFAFYGTYADNPASVSPIGQEMDRLREISGSLGEFIRVMSGFGSYQEFKDYLALRDGGADAGKPAP